MQNFHDFKLAKYFPRLDGLRAVSVLLVVAYHSSVPALVALNGRIGVTIFFVISGFLITTLLLREEEEDGRVSLRGFYLRRSFRILPLYYIALGLSTLAVVLGFGDKSTNYWDRLPYFLTYMNELVGSGTFQHSWSLAIEEKFYLIWPALVFVMPLAVRRRRWIALVILVATCSAGLFAPDGGYVGMYAPIIAGCFLAVVANSPDGFRSISFLSTSPGGLALSALAVLSVFFSPESRTQVMGGLAFALAFPFLLFGDARLTGWLGHRWLTYIGRRAYAIYLFHPLVGKVVQTVVHVERGPIFQWTHFAATLLLTVALAEVLHRGLEKPLHEKGKLLARKYSNKNVESRPLSQAH
ncbi:acyltransferase family protein [bacterium RCC_150]